MLHVHVKIHSDPALPKGKYAEIDEAAGSYFKRQRQASAGNFSNTVKIYTIHVLGYQQLHLCGVIIFSL